MKNDIIIKVLIIDDDETSIKGIRDHCKDAGWECKVTGFDKSYKQIMQWNPDVVVLDLCEAGVDAGTPVLDSIWVNGYRPIVIFSGNIDSITLKEEYNANELIQKYSKGDEQPVNDFLDDLQTKKFIIVNRTAGLDIIYPDKSKDLTPVDLLTMYYERGITS